MAAQVVREKQKQGEEKESKTLKKWIMYKSLLMKLNYQKKKF